MIYSDCDMTGAPGRRQRLRERQRSLGSEKSPTADSCPLLFPLLGLLLKIISNRLASKFEKCYVLCICKPGVTLETTPLFLPLDRLWKGGHTARWNPCSPCAQCTRPATTCREVTLLLPTTSSEGRLHMVSNLCSAGPSGVSHIEASRGICQMNEYIK